MVLPAPLRRPCPRTMLEIPTSGHTPALLSAIKDEGRGLGLGLRPMPPPNPVNMHRSVVPGSMRLQAALALNKSSQYKSFLGYVLVSVESCARIYKSSLSQSVLLRLT